MSSKVKYTALVTGGNRGLGFECARALITRGYRMILACRNMDAAKNAAAELKKNTINSAEIITVPLDLASLDSVRQCVQLLADDKLLPLDALFCNAGIQIVSGLEKTQDGIEKTFAVNHLGHFLLANLLIPHLNLGARIIFTSSGTHDPKQKTGLPPPRFVSPEQIAYPDKGTGYVESSVMRSGQMWYSTSKLCNIMCAYEMAKRLNSASEEKLKSIWVAAFDPGLMPGTGLARTYPWALRKLWSGVLPALTLFSGNVHTPKTSGDRLATLGVAEYKNHKSGLYFEGLTPIKSSDLSMNEFHWLALWNYSMELSMKNTSECVLNAASEQCSNSSGREMLSERSISASI